METETIEPGPATLEQLLTELEQNGYNTVPALKVYLVASEFIRKYDVLTELQILDRFCRYLNWSLDQEKPEHSYVACGFKKEHVISWIEHIKAIAVKCLISMSKLKPDLQTDSKSLSVFLSVIVNLTSMPNWRITKLEEYKALENGILKLTNNVFSNMITEGHFYENINILLQAGYTRPGKISFTKTNLYAIASLSARPIIDPLFSSDSLMMSYITKVFSVPGFMHYVHVSCPESIPESIFSSTVTFLVTDARLDLILKDKDICFMVSLLANLIDCSQYSLDLVQILFPAFLNVLLTLSKYCEVELSASKKCHWHPVLGWVSAPIPIPYLNSVDAVRTQLETLWKPAYIRAFFHPLFYQVESRIEQLVEADRLESTTPRSSSWKSGIVKFFKRIIPGESRRRLSTAPSTGNNISSDITKRVSLVCTVYNSIIASLSSSKVDILTGLCFKDSSFLPISLWIFLEEMSSEHDIKGWVDVLVTPGQVQEALILLFCEVLTHFITVLDDQELYDEEKVFKLSSLSDIGHFINNLCYRLLCHSNYTKVRPVTWNALKVLLMVLYRRDSRRRFCPEGLWLIDSGRMNTLITDIDKGRRSAKRTLLEMPHVIKEEARVIFFRKWAASEKSHCAYHSADDMIPSASTSTSASASPLGQPTSSLITVRRGRIVEDGYAQLANLSPRRLKGTIRVRFQNELGLDEAGIDQDGVFKEFLEETISRVFSPTLNLFKATSENLLYPSPLSYLHEDHLDLFEFVGKMLGKAVFEGIVVDVHFAPFFVTQMLGGLQQNGLLFSVIDELQSLDRELYNSLIYIKHYQGDIKDLELTFSVDQDILGQVKTVELIPGGRTIPVTNENKINYIYLKAHFHLYAQIKEPTIAFLRGFRYLIPNEWLRIFSPPELQRLISGEDSDIDLEDLRRNTQYYGGFHDSHRVIVWLWDILEHDLTEEERRLFLKFVTSCSKPPLLGFANLDPAFSVRCVEVSDDDDTGDTIGSVLRGFLTLGKQEPVGRLPTSSTCFNLLKLPNYHKKNTLRDKLRYAITSNVGFELS